MIKPADWTSESFEQRMLDLFAPGGLLSRAKNYEHRGPQQEMAGAVASAIENGQHLIVEAGTGVGKSMAYLIPAIYSAVEQGRKAIICTHTINLQEQLFHKDIPILKRLLPFSFEAALLKGRQNYLCPRRLDRALRASNDLFVSSERKELERIREWAQQTKDGTLSDFEQAPDMRVWSQVCSEPHICTSRTCGNDPGCYYHAARKRILDSQVLVMNHTLFFTHLGGMDEESEAEDGYLFPNDFVIFDEAHNLDMVAARHVGLNFSTSSMRYMLYNLYNPRTRKGLLQRHRRAEAERKVISLLDELEQFGGRVEKACRLDEANERRVRQPDLVEDSLSLPIMALRQELLELTDDLDNGEDQSEIREYSRRLSEMRSELTGFLSQKEEGHVYWVERQGRQGLQLQGAPVDLAAVLRQLIFRPEHTTVMASATLSADRGLGYFQNRVGGEQAVALQLESPFDYERQMRVYIPRSMPEPKEREKYEATMEYWIRHFVQQTHGKAFVLFTSYATMQRLAAKLEPWFRHMEIELLVQGSGRSRHMLLSEFKRDTDSVLFGTDSFWQGVDVPGEALSNVIITRLPFSVPDHPLVEARIELIEERGGDAFREFSLPEAILKFRQGVGRLIRTQSDEGQIAILDTRVISKGYGRSFLAMLPPCPVTVLNESGEPDYRLS